ncbi:MAG: hypothetical protein R2853_21825 [Thermomicrobiales bacterium]
MVWLAVWGLAVVLNSVPAFMPPTWAVLTDFHLYHALPIVPLAIVGVPGSTAGRALLALGSRAFGARFVPASWRANIEGLVETLQGQPTLANSTLLLFTLGPLPSNQLFIAAGLARAPLAPMLLVFGVARCVSYVLWVSAANSVDRSLREAPGPRTGRWQVVVVQLARFALLFLSCASTGAMFRERGGWRRRGAPRL